MATAGSAPVNAGAASRQPQPQPVAAISHSGSSLLYACQQCRKQIPLDGSAPIPHETIEAFDAAFTRAHKGGRPSAGPSAADLLGESFVLLPASRLAASVAPPPQPSATSGSALAARLLGVVGGGGSGNSSGVSVAAAAAAASSNSATAAPTNWHQQVASVSRVLDIVTARCPVAAPLCGHCAHLVYAELDRRLMETEKDKDEYQRHLNLLVADQPADGDANANEAQLAAQEDAEEAELAREEAELEEKLAALRREKQALHFECSSLESESAKLSELESGFWREYEEYALQLQQLTDEQAHVKNQIKNASETLDRMKRTNVFDDAFHISHDGHFATINGFRLGRLPAQPVEWAETSAALGQVLLLLATMARHTGYKFQKYRLMPMGSYSKMARLDDLSTTYELYGSNDLILGRLFWYRRFDTALVWLLACVHEFGEYAHACDQKFALKYSIRNDMIGDVSIKLQFNNDEKWTKSLKYLLTNLKFLLVWSSLRMAK